MKSRRVRGDGGVSAVELAPVAPVRRGRGDRGAALVEAALVLPVMMMLVLGIVTFGDAYDRKQTLTHAAREATRYGATLPTGSNLNAWLDTVAGVAVSNATGNLEAAVDGRYVCVAYVAPAGSTRRVQQLAAAPSYDNAACFADGLVGPRVQVVAERRTLVDIGMWSRVLTLTARSSTRFEARP